mmetsp:Transcript_29762/g.55842  ORF Transcript_29762/g.55842 Transcript_29762/m.55842 type:complete len:82 (+) Transcript_29762:2345-2590(+)
MKVIKNVSFILNLNTSLLFYVPCSSMTRIFSNMKFVHVVIPFQQERSTKSSFQARAASISLDFRTLSKYNINQTIKSVSMK